MTGGCQCGPDDPACGCGAVHPPAVGGGGPADVEPIEAGGYAYSGGAQMMNAEDRAELRTLAEADSRMGYPTKGAVQEALGRALDALDEAEQARAEVVALRTAVEALADEFDSKWASLSVREVAASLRAALAATQDGAQ